MINLLKYSGVVLTIIGLIWTPIFYIIINSVALAAIGWSVIIVGLTSIALSKNDPESSLKTSRTLIILLLSIVIIFLYINVVLYEFWRTDYIGIYFGMLAISYMIILMVYFSFNPESNSTLNIVSLGVFAVSLLIIASRISEIVS